MKTTRPCPYCKKPAPWEGNPYRPFCSKRCRMIDLGNWAAGNYCVPGEPVTDADIEKDAEEALSKKEQP